MTATRIRIPEPAQRARKWLNTNILTPGLQAPGDRPTWSGFRDFDQIDVRDRIIEPGDLGSRGSRLSNDARLMGYWVDFSYEGHLLVSLELVSYDNDLSISWAVSEVGYKKRYPDDSGEWVQWSPELNFQP